MDNIVTSPNGTKFEIMGIGTDNNGKVKFSIRNFATDERFISDMPPYPPYPDDGDYDGTIEYPVDRDDEEQP